MAEDGKGGAIDEATGRLRERFSTPEEEEALALETLGTAQIAGLGPQVMRYISVSGDWLLWPPGW